MELKQFITERITKNKLALDIDTAYETVMKYGEIYPESTDIKRFFHYVLNTIGAKLHTVDHEISEILGWLKVRGRGEITFYEFETPEDYLNWLNARFEIYKSLNYDDTRLLNFIEMSCMDFITDITTTCRYEITNNKEWLYVTKDKFSFDSDTTKSHIKYIVSMFNKGYIFKPIN